MQQRGVLHSLHKRQQSDKNAARGKAQVTLPSCHAQGKNNDNYQ
jgi:hypothetical protein